MDLRILKGLARQIAELRILKDLGKSAVDGSQLTADRIEKNPSDKVGVSDSAGGGLSHRTRLSPIRGRKMRSSSNTLGGWPIEGYTHPRQFGSLSKHRGYKEGSSEHVENR